MATISQLEINGTTYNILDANTKGRVDQLETAVSNKVSKTGDTMTGALTVNNNITTNSRIAINATDNYQKGFVVTDTNFPLTKTITAQKDSSGLAISSTNNFSDFAGRVFIRDHSNNNRMMITEVSRTVNGTRSWNSIGVGLNSSNQAVYSVSNAANFRSTIGAASTAVATTSADGLMSSSDKTKLNGLSNFVARYINLASPAVNKTFTFSGAGWGPYMILSGSVPGSMWVSDNDQWYACIPRPDGWCYYAGTRSGDTFKLTTVERPYSSIQWVIKLN